jgi:Peptidase S46.
MKFRSLRLSMALSAVIAAAPMMIAAPGVSAARDEGMWTFDNFPLRTVNEKYDLNLDQAWLDRVRMAAVRIQGCSASFVSPEGLILTNHHCVVGCLQELSSPETDYVKNGFIVGSREEEKKCPGQTAEVLTEIADVTDRMLMAGMGMEGQAFAQARQAEVARIAQENCAGDPKFNCQVVDFYRGGRFALYKYRRYEDVRIAFAPEFQAAFFGGDPDNFNFPRYALDASFLRAYEDGRPVETPNHLRWNADAPREGEPTFVVGNPGSTSRLLTVSQLERLRDQQLPVTLIQASELRGRFLTYAASGDEARRVSVDPIFGLENSFKAQYGQHQALLDPSFMATKRQEEARLRAAVEADPALKQRIGDPWSELEAIQSVARDLYLPYRQLAASAGGGSQLFAYARAIGRAAAQNAAGQLTAERKAQLEAALGEETPIYVDMEEIRLGYWLSKTREYLTVDHPQVKALLGKESPEGLADRVIGGTRLGDPAFRVAALSMTPEELAAADPLIAWVMANDAAAQAVAGEWNQKVTIPTAQAAERVAQARFAVYGSDIYPDATFTLRISYGEVKGWTYRGVEVPAFTRIGGLYERHTGAEPFNAAAGFLAAEGRINKDLVFDFASTNDIIGGNSGSPVINARGEVIGAAFDGNIHSLGGAFGYDAALNRTVSVSTAAITESLRVVYPQPRLLRELGVRG